MKQILISDIIEELKRLQIERGNLPVFAWTAKADSEDWNAAPAWPTYIEKENSIMF